MEPMIFTSVLKQKNNTAYEKVWRRDKKDMEALGSLILKEKQRLIENGYSETLLKDYMDIYEKAVQDTRNCIVGLIQKDLVPEVSMQYISFYLQKPHIF